MADRRALITFDPAALVASIEELERRIEALEQAAAAGALRQQEAASERTAISPTAAERRDGEWTVAGTVTLIGRTLIALGGAYLLRALTEGAVVAPGIGVLAGAAYAVTWLALCVRAADAGLRPSAVFHGLTGAIVGFPLVWEATVRFALLPPESAAVALAIFTTLVLLAARRAATEPVAWCGALGGTLTALVLAVNTGAFISFTLVVAATGIATLWLGYLDGWVLLRWPAAGAVNLMVLAITIREATAKDVRDVGDTVTLQLFVLAIYLGSFVARTLFLGREVIFFEVAQSAAAMAVCFGGALWVLNTAGVTAVPLGIAAIVLGVAAYAFSFAFVEPRCQRRNVMFFTTLAVAFVLAGVVLAAPLGAATLVTGALALACSEWSRRSNRLTLALHATIFAAGMATLSGLAGLASSALGSAATQAWPAVTPVMMVTLAVVIVCAAAPVPMPTSGIDTAAPRAFRLWRLALVVWLTAGGLIALAAPLLTSPAGTGADPGIVATLRTLVLVAFAGGIVLYRHRYPAAVRVWTAYAVLAAIGLKLLIEDMTQGRPATLFVALAAYGTALILIPRFARRLA